MTVKDVFIARAKERGMSMTAYCISINEQANIVERITKPLLRRTANKYSKKFDIDIKHFKILNTKSILESALHSNHKYANALIKEAKKANKTPSNFLILNKLTASTFNKFIFQKKKFNNANLKKISKTIKIDIKELEEYSKTVKTNKHTSDKTWLNENPIVRSYPTSIEDFI